MADAVQMIGGSSFQALLTLSNPGLVPDERMVGQLVALGTFEWSEVLDLARRHRIGPFVGHRVDALASELGKAGFGPSDAVMASFRGEVQAALFHEMALLAELQRIKMRFDAAGITFLVIKGLVLSSQCHGRMGLRINHDIDLVVTPPQLMAAHDVLVSMGCRLVEPAGDPTPENLLEWAQRTKDFVYLAAVGNTIIELHHRLFDNKALCDPAVFARARTVTLFDQTEVLTLDEGDTIAYLALHGALHAWSRLKWLIDLALVCTCLDPSVMAAIVRKTRGAATERALSQAMALLRKFYALECVPPTREAWRTRVLVAAANRAIVNSGARELEDTSFGTTLKNASHYLLWARWRYLVAELTFDLTDTSRDKIPVREFGPIWFSRIRAWLGRHARRQPIA